MPAALCNALSAPSATVMGLSVSIGSAEESLSSGTVSKKSSPGWPSRTSGFRISGRMHLNVIELKVNGLKFNWDLNNLWFTRLGDHWRRLIAKNRSLARRKKLGLSWAC